MPHHNGGALISALFITAIVAMLATALAISQRFLIHEEQLVTRSDQLYLQLQGEQALALQIIKKYKTQRNVPFVPLNHALPEMQVDGVTLRGVIDDEAGKYNINHLVYAENQIKFVTLLQKIMPTLSNNTALNIAKSITAWETIGAQNPSSRHEMVNISELRLIAGITPDIYSAIAPFVTALPVAKSSGNNGQYFLIQTQASLGDQVVSLNRLVVTRREKNNKLGLVTIWQAFE